MEGNTQRLAGQSYRQVDVGRGEQSQRGEDPDPSELTHRYMWGIQWSGESHLQTRNMPDSTVPCLVLTIRPAHGIIQHAGDTSPQGALGRVARVHAPCVVVIAPVQLVLKEISPVIVGPGEDGIDATWREAEVGDGSWVPFLYVVVLKHPVSVSWW